MPDTAAAAAQLQSLLHLLAPLRAPSADRVRSDLAAAAFHLSRLPSDRPIVALIGGTGTGKSTLVNRLLDRAPGAELTIASFKRTYTAGPIAIAAAPLPPGFASLPHVPAETLPARGQADRVTTVTHDHSLLATHSIIDTPDIDGELPEHHLLADRIFRWCDAVIFLVTPEKYQMTELQPYYRLSQRYTLPALFVMNKLDAPEVLIDYRAALARAGITVDPLTVARDDSTWQPSAEIQLNAARVAELRINVAPAGAGQRVNDALARLNDQLLQPMLDRRQALDRATAAVRAMGGGDTAGIDVHPLTRQLQEKMRERSVLYLIGPQRMLDRLRRTPAMLGRLPRGLWDWSRGGDFKLIDTAHIRRDVPPDFRAVVIEQFQALQTRIDDTLRNTGIVDFSALGDWKLDPAAAGTLVDEQLAELRNWLESRSSAVPRDTRIVNKLLKLMGLKQNVTHYGEAAPYLLAVATVTSVAWAAKTSITGGLDDLLIFGGYSLFTWLTHKLSDEVAAKTKATNDAINNRYQRLADDQIDRALSWLQTLAPPRKLLNAVAEQVDRIRATV